MGLRILYGQRLVPLFAQTVQKEQSFQQRSLSHFTVEIGTRRGMIDTFVWPTATAIGGYSIEH